MRYPDVLKENFGSRNSGRPANDAGHPAPAALASAAFQVILRHLLVFFSRAKSIENIDPKRYAAPAHSSAVMSILAICRAACMTRCETRGDQCARHGAGKRLGDGDTPASRQSLLLGTGLA
jgi:hypothetical protein